MDYTKKALPRQGFLVSGLFLETIFPKERCQDQASSFFVAISR